MSILLTFKILHTLVVSSVSCKHWEFSFVRLFQISVTQRILFITIVFLRIPCTFKIPFLLIVSLISFPIWGSSLAGLFHWYLAIFFVGILHTLKILYIPLIALLSRAPLKFYFVRLFLLLSRALLEFYFVRLFRKTKEKSKSAQDSKYIASCKSARELNKLISSTNEITKGARDT